MAPTTWPSTTIGSPPLSGADQTLRSGVRPPTIASSRILVGFWKSAAVRAFSVEMVAPIGKVGCMRSRYIRLPPSSTTAIDAPSLPFVASATAAAATALAPSSVSVVLLTVVWAWARPATAHSARATRQDPRNLMASSPLLGKSIGGDTRSNAGSPPMVPRARRWDTLRTRRAWNLRRAPRSCRQWTSSGQVTRGAESRQRERQRDAGGVRGDPPTAGRLHRSRALPGATCTWSSGTSRTAFAAPAGTASRSV